MSRAVPEKMSRSFTLSFLISLRVTSGSRETVIYKKSSKGPQNPLLNGLILILARTRHRIEVTGCLKRADLSI